MDPPGHEDVTTLLLEWSKGSKDALNQLMSLVYAELRQIAARHLRGERANHTLQSTALVNEVYLRLIDQNRVRCGTGTTSSSLPPNWFDAFWSTTRGGRSR